MGTAIRVSECRHCIMSFYCDSLYENTCSIKTYKDKSSDRL